MAKLIYGMMISLDGYIHDAEGDFDWGQIDDAVHQHANDEERRVGLAIYGRRMYEAMVYWETADSLPGSSAIEREFSEIWQGHDKVVVSKTLADVKSRRTRLVRDLTLADLEQHKASTTGDVSISGPTLAAPFLAAGVVDELAIYHVPILVGPGGVAFAGHLPKPTRLERIETVPFDNGVLFARYRVRR